MASVKIEIEDITETGKVKVVCTPHGSELLRRFKEGYDMTKAEAMSVMFLLKILDDSRKADFNDRRLVVPAGLES